MGPIDHPPIPTAWRERNNAPFGHPEKGLELIGRKDAEGKPLVFWARDYNGAYKAAEAAGFRF